MDIWIRNGTLVTMDAERRVIDADLVLRNDRILRILPRGPRGIDERDVPRPAQVIDASGSAVIPGLIQSHVHLCQTLFRGAADDLPLLEWLKQRIWPFEAAHDAQSLNASAELGLAEMIAGGTTCILDMGTVHHHDVVFEAMAKSGIRGVSGKAMMDQGEGVPKGLRESTRASLRESERLCRTYNGKAGGRLRYAYAPRFILSCSERLLRETALLAKETNSLVHSHAAEHHAERVAVRELLGQDDVSALASYGITGPNAVLAHGVQLRKSEMKALGQAGTRFVHCPSANLKLASGIADVQTMLSQGMEVGIGADGAPCNNRMDIFVEMREAGLLAKARHQDASALPPMDVLSLATIRGAKVLGLDAEIGSLEEGKKADVVVVRTDTVESTPGGDVVSRIVYCGSSRHVRHVFVDGVEIARDGAPLLLDAERVKQQASTQFGKLMGRLNP